MVKQCEPSVAVIVLNWNSYKDTFDCLKSLQKLNYKNFQVFLVDNKSKDGSYEKLKDSIYGNEFNININLLQTEKNLGFAGGNNKGIKKAFELGFDYVWMLNNDTEVDANSLSSLIDVIDSSVEIGIVGSKIYYFGTDLIWFAGGKVNHLLGLVKHRGIKQKDVGQYNSLKEVDYITGCSLLFRTNLIDDIGYMEEDYFLYYEETDWNLKASNSNWRIFYVPDSIVHHKVSSSSGGEKNLNPIVDYYYIRNSIVLIKRSHSKLYYYMYSIVVLFKILRKYIRIILRNENNKLIRFKHINKGFIDGFSENMGKFDSL